MMGVNYDFESHFLFVSNKYNFFKNIGDGFALQVPKIFAKNFGQKGFYSLTYGLSYSLLDFTVTPVFDCNSDIC